MTDQNDNVFLNGGSVSNGDFVTYVAKSIGSGVGSFYMEFEVAQNGLINFAEGHESNDFGRKDLTLGAIVLTNTSAANAVVSGVVTPDNNNYTAGTPPQTKAVDGFNASWANLLAGNVYRLTVNYTAAATGNLAVFNGSMSFSAVPIPPALLMFGSAILGLGFLARRRKANAINFRSGIAV